MTNLIEFIATIPGLEDQKDILPYESDKSIPEWWRSAPYDSNIEESKYQPESMFVRRCPAFPDLFSSGYILPMWADTTIYFNKKNYEWRWRCGQKESPFIIDFFDGKAFSDYGKYYLNGLKANAIFQFHSPWMIRSSENISIFQFPIFYSDTDGFGVMPGTFDADLTAQMKIEVGYFFDEKEVFIKKGTPLVQYIPYQKINSELIIRGFTEEDRKHLNKFNVRSISSFKNWYSQNRRRPSHG